MGHIRFSSASLKDSCLNARGKSKGIVWDGTAPLLASDPHLSANGRDDQWTKFVKSEKPHKGIAHRWRVSYSQ
jgi:hypothetical protein